MTVFGGFCLKLEAPCALGVRLCTIQLSYLFDDKEFDAWILFCRSIDVAVVT
jgi:hypothetical protein